MQHRVICFASDCAAHGSFNDPQSDWNVSYTPLVNLGFANPYTRWAPPFPEMTCAPAAFVSIGTDGSCTAFKSVPTYMAETWSPIGRQDGRKITEIDLKAVQDTQPHELPRTILRIIHPTLYGMSSWSLDYVNTCRPISALRR